MRVLVACEESQAVCKAFRALGHEAYSADILRASGGHQEWHLRGDVLDVLYYDWDMMIAFPPCTYISYVGTRHWNEPGRLEKRMKALDFFAKLWLAPIAKICIENPRGCASPAVAKYSQIIHPYYFGDEAQKTTCLWLKNLPKLVHDKEDTLFSKATHVDKGEMLTFKSGKTMPKWYDDLSNNGHMRSKTFPGVALTMAQQWG